MTRESEHNHTYFPQNTILHRSSFFNSKSNNTVVELSSTKRFITFLAWIWEYPSIRLAFYRIYLPHRSPYFLEYKVVRHEIFIKSDIITNLHISVSQVRRRDFNIPVLVSLRYLEIFSIGLLPISILYKRLLILRVI